MRPEGEIGGGLSQDGRTVLIYSICNRKAL